MPCDSGRDNQLRVKSPPMIVIINQTNIKTQTKPTKNNKFRGWFNQSNSLSESRGV